jgi:uncharacterized protein (TIGR02757 family)
MVNDSRLKKLLDYEADKRNCAGEVSYDMPDPVLVARRYREPYSALVCALFAYGTAELIVHFLDSLDFSLLDMDEAAITQVLSSHYYRFQNSRDISEFFITISRLKRETDLETVFLKGYLPQQNVICGINAVIEKMRGLNPYKSRGYDFLIGKTVEKARGASALKRWMMFLRWMVRSDEVDPGGWDGLPASALVVPLDTHMYQIASGRGFTSRKQANLKAALEITEHFRQINPEDPVKYDFVLTRFGIRAELDRNSLMELLPSMPRL